MAIPDGFWTANLEATKDRMNQNLVQFDTLANRPAAASTNKGMYYVATDNLDTFYSNGTNWIDLGTFSLPSQAEAEAGTATTERVWTAQRVKQAIEALGSSGLKAAGTAQAGGTLNAGSINITSSAKTSTGRYTWTIATDFADANWFPLCNPESGDDKIGNTETPTAGTVVITMWDASAAALTDTQHKFVGVDS